LEHLQSRKAIKRGFDLVAAARECSGKETRDSRLVFDDQNPRNRTPPRAHLLSPPFRPPTYDSCGRVRRGFFAGHNPMSSADRHLIWPGPRPLRLPTRISPAPGGELDTVEIPMSAGKKGSEEAVFVQPRRRMTGAVTEA